MTAPFAFLSQQITCPAWIWLIASGCMVFCLIQLADYFAKRKWRQRGPITPEELDDE